MTLTQDRLKELLSYDSETGLFTRMNSIHRRWRIGSTNTNGHLQIRVENKLFMAYRLAWLYVYGSWPNGSIDHIDGDKINNRIGNLRDTTNKQNCENRTLNSNSPLGFRGVSKIEVTGRFRAGIGHMNKQVHVGVFATPQEAAAAAKQARDQLFTHHKTPYSA